MIKDNELFLIVEGVEPAGPLAGSGNTTVISSIVRGFENIALVGLTSNDEEIGNWKTVVVEGRKIKFLPVMSVKRQLNPLTGSAIVDFTLAVYRHRHALLELGTDKIFTRTYGVIWLLALLRKEWDVCFYYPGLGNPMLVGRKIWLTKFFARIYTLVQAYALRAVSPCAFAAAPVSEVSAFNRRLEQLSVGVEVKTLPTAVDVSVFFPQETGCAEPGKTLRLIFVGRLAEVKGIPLLFNALKILIDEYSLSATLYLVGDGECREELAALADSMSLSDSVVFFGLLNRLEVAKAINRADVAVVSSYVEGFSNAMLEQIACGKPMVSTQISGADELIKGGVNGVVVQSRDPTEYARAILRASSLVGVVDYNVSLIRQNYTDEAMWETLHDSWLTRVI